jgi:hypothetical protein
VEGGDDGGCRLKVVNEATIDLTYDALVKYGDNVTVDLMVSPQNSLVWPTPWQVFFRRLYDWRWVPFVLAPLGLIIGVWPIICGLPPGILYP